VLLEIKKINSFYGMSHILFDLSLEVEEREIICLLGRNGVGKTTTLRSIMGLTPPRSGSIRFAGRDLRGRRPFEIARTGIGFVPEDRLIIPDLSVKDNLEIAVRRTGPWSLDAVYALFPRLEERKYQAGGTLSGGEQQMLTIGRALMTNPELLVMDEPSEGLAPAVVRLLGDFMKVLKEKGMTTLLAEQNSKFALAFSDRAYMLEKGKICWRGGGAELKENREIMKRYLGV
jgi:branched-chain amino acid transport system ATP-binding protein